MKIRLDAAYDLSQSGHPTDDDSVAQFEEAYLSAANREADDREIEIEFLTPDDRDYLGGGGSTEEENEVWQAIHDRLDYIDGEWS